MSSDHQIVPTEILSASWDCLGLGTFSGEYNMQLDRQLFLELCDGTRANPVLRFYQWASPTVSLGKNQLAHEVVLIDQINELGYELVTRPTGGRALLHKGDLCYAIVGGRHSHPEFRTLSSTYRAIGNAISDMIKSYGVELISLPANGNDSHKSYNPCFAMLSPFEVTVRGKKICGSAQFRSGDIFLQHGSIRIRDNWNQKDLESLWPRGFSLDPAKVTCLDTEIGVSVSPEDVETRLVAAFASRFKVKITAPL
jgi:lipoate-protein ligase A